jgi:hypothetical protein
MPLRKVQENQVGLKLNGIHQLLVYADDDILLVDNINTIKRNREALIDSNKEVSLEVGMGETKYMLMSCHQNAGQNHSLITNDRSFENAATFKQFGMTPKNKNCIKRRFNMGNACYHSVQLSSHILSKNINTKIYKTLEHV